MFSSLGFSSGGWGKSSVDFSKVTFEEVGARFAYVLAEVPDILEIEVFGSMAREGEGHDLDLILIVTEPNWRSFESMVNFLDLAVANGKNEDLRLVSGPGRRFRAMEYVLGSGLGEALSKLELDTGVPLDVYLFPSDWKSRLPELQRVFPHEDPKFMENIAKDVQSLEEMLTPA